MLDEIEKSEESTITAPICEIFEIQNDSKNKLSTPTDQNPEKKRTMLNLEEKNRQLDDPLDTDDETEPSDSYSVLPEKSKLTYERQYIIFLEWCKKKNFTEYNESVLLQYFTEKSAVFKSSTLWSIFSMLRATMVLKTNINISKYKKLTAFLKKKAIGYKSEKSKIFTREEVNRYLTEAPDESCLMMKVY